MTYPNNLQYFVTKIDKNASGWYVSGENFDVPSSSPYTMYLDHVPKDMATTHVYASGYREDEWFEISSGTPSASGEFLVDYDTGLVEFYSGDANRSVEAVYITHGDDIMAEHVNTLQWNASGVQKELGLGIRGVYRDLAERLDNIGDGITVNASQVTCIAPGGATFTTVQGHIDATAGVVSDDNPHGLTWHALFETNGNIVEAEYSATLDDIFADNIHASGNYIALNWDGPDYESRVLFYDGGDPAGQWLKWDDDDNRFELSTDLYIHGNITASGSFMISPSGSDTSIQYNDNGYFGGDLDLTWDGSTFTTNNITASGVLMPDASGTVDIGSIALAFDQAYIDWVYLTADPIDPLGAATKQYVDAAMAVAAPGGLDTEIQFNNNGVLDGATSLTYNDVSGDVTFGASIIASASGTQDIGTAAVTFGTAYIDNIYIASTPTLPNHAATVQYVDAQASGYNEFTELTDTPSSYSTYSASGVRVNTGETGLEFYDITSQTQKSGHVHNQTVASSSWVITHNINSLNVIIQVTDGSSPENIVVPSNIELTDANTTTITFPTAQTGVARIISLRLA